MPKYQFSEMSIVHKIVSLVLYAGHSDKQVYCTLDIPIHDKDTPLILTGL